MKTNSMMKSIKFYIMELIIVATGVLIALFLSNLKESNQARKFHKASIKTINSEIEANYSDLKVVVEKQTKFLDTLKKYRDTPIVIGEIFTKSGGLQGSELSNTGLDLYKRNQIKSIDFEMISTLNQMYHKTKTIDVKLNRLVEFAYLNILDDSKESKKVLYIHLQDALGSEKQLMKLYKDYIDSH